MRVVIAYISRPQAMRTEVQYKTIRSIQDNIIELMLHTESSKIDIIFYPQELVKGKNTWQLLELIDGLDMKEFNKEGDHAKNLYIWLCINQCWMEHLNSDFICIWFDDVWIEKGGLMTALKDFDVFDVDCLGLPALGGEQNTFQVPMRWFIFKTKAWRKVNFNDLIEWYRIPQVYIAGLEEIFNNPRGLTGEAPRAIVRDNIKFKHLHKGGAKP